MARKPEERRCLIAVASPEGSQKLVVVLGVPTGAWEYMRSGLTHNFDLEAATGLPIQIIMYGGINHDAIKTVVDRFMAKSGMPDLDDRPNADFGADKPEADDLLHTHDCGLYDQGQPLKPCDCGLEGRLRHKIAELKIMVEGLG